MANCSAPTLLAGRLAQEPQKVASPAEEITPSTAVPESEDELECSKIAGSGARRRSSSSSDTSSSGDEDCYSAPAPRQLQPGPPPPPTVPSQLEPGPPPPTSAGGREFGSSCPRPSGPRAAPATPCPELPQDEKFTAAETFFVFDWDDTVLPSTWLQRNGLRLDAASRPTAEQRELLAKVAFAARKTFRAARLHGKVILLTNAERGWIELSCQKFLPTLAPMLENVKLVSARTTYEGPQYPSPLDWKLRAFEAEITNFFGPGALSDPSKRKNVFSVGDSIHEREALLRATSSAPCCNSKCLKFVERPDISQLCKQHELITECFERIVHHDGNLDLCIRCP